MRFLRVFVLAVAFSCLLAGCMQPAGPERAGDGLQADAEDLQWFRDARFGLFVHWGPVSLKGTEIGWSRAGERRGRAGKGTEVPVEIYDNLYKEFNPVDYDPQAWCAMAKAAGMKYVVFTTKHHDGFCMFDSKLTDYKITNSPYGRDIVGELADACHKSGLKLGFYYSPPDWHHPDYRTENHAKYIAYLHGQIKELCTNYGKVDILWFDGLGGKPEDWNSVELIRNIRRWQPGILINNRAGLPADYDTPEQRVGSFQVDRPWESCMTIASRWSYRPDDPTKSLPECLRILVRTAGGDGNLLLNVGPRPDGTIEPEQVGRLKEIGRWLNKHGQSIYKTAGGPFKPMPWGVSTHRGNKIYLHVLHWDTPVLELPAIQPKVVKSYLLTGGDTRVEQDDKGLRVSVPPALKDEVDTVIVLELDGPAGDIVPVTPPSGSVACGCSAKSSKILWDDDAHHAGRFAFDDDFSSSWMPHWGSEGAWLEVDLGQPRTLNRAVISEGFDRVRAFEIQAKRGERWETFLKGDRVGRLKTLTFDPVTTRQVRLVISKVSHRPEITEFQLFEAKP